MLAVRELYKIYAVTVQVLASCGLEKYKSVLEQGGLEQIVGSLQALACCG